MSGNLSNNNPSPFPTFPYKLTNSEETRNLSHSYLLHLPNQSNHSAIKRTLSSVHMSCPKMVANDRMNRTQSHENFSKLQKSEDYKEDGVKKRAFEDIWSSIQVGSKSGSGQVPPPYVHPLVRRSTSSLSDKSLEICTESLGSETGSDGFTCTDWSDDHEHEVEEVHLLSSSLSKITHNVVVGDDGVKFGGSKTGPISLGRSPSTDLGSRTKSFPPPLSSLAQRDGSNIQIRSHRQHGRLVLEAVSVPSSSCFRAQRNDGRLLLTLANDVFEEEEVDEESEEEEEKEEEEMGECGEDMSKNVEHVSPNRLIIDDFIMSKVRALPRFSSTWPRTINVAVVKALDNRRKEKNSSQNEKKLLRGVIKSSGPIMSAVSAKAGSIINTYEYYWKQSTTVAVLKSVVGQQIAGRAISAAPQVVESEREINKLVIRHEGKPMSLIQQGVVLLKAERVGAKSAIGERAAHDEYLVPLLRGCKEHRMKSFLFLDPHCIVTT